MPITDELNAKAIMDIECSNTMICALTEEGEIYKWGEWMRSFTDEKANEKRKMG